MTPEQNKELIQKYPFLYPVYDPYGMETAEYDYSYTEMDSMPEGWRNAFGDLILDDILKILKKADYESKYQIVQIKEKFGELRWYDNGIPQSISEELYYTLAKYEYVSGYICVKCGKFPAKMRSYRGWISPYCDKCAAEIKEMTTVDQEEFDPDIRFVKYRKGKKEEILVSCRDVVERVEEKNGTQSHI